LFVVVGVFLVVVGGGVVVVGFLFVFFNGKNDVYNMNRNVPV
jgi:hypothetical protein